MKRLARNSFTWSIVALTFMASATRADAQGNDNVNARVASALEPLGRVNEIAREADAGWLWTELQLFDEDYPLTVDVVSSSDSAPQKVIYFFPGGGTNFHASYFTPHQDNVAHYFREHGYVVVGITPREDNVPEDVWNQGFAAGWGLQKHREDVRHVIERVQGQLGLPYEVLGHSYGASLALDYGANFSGELERLIILDIYAFDPGKHAQSIRNAQRTYSAYNQLIAFGVHLEAMGSILGDLATWTDEQRAADSGFPRSIAAGAYRGNFTNEALYYYTMLETHSLPGGHTLFSGLKGDWPVVKGYVAGSYTLADDPRQDSYEMTHIDEATLVAGSSAAGSGMVPSAFSRDYWAAVAGNGQYKLEWGNIQCPFLWINTEFGYGEQNYGAFVARGAGNDRVTTHVVEGYAHIDIFVGRNARDEVWPLFNQ